jgi:hypothetical protein
MPKKKQEAVIDAQQQDDINALNDIRQYGEETFDKLILSLSGGALVFTIGFIKDILGSKPIEYKYVLVSAWILFACSLTFNLISQRTSVYAVDAHLKADACKSNILNRITHGLNNLACLLFVVGIILFVIFAVLNL